MVAGTNRRISKVENQKLSLGIIEGCHEKKNWEELFKIFTFIAGDLLQMFSLRLIGLLDEFAAHFCLAFQIS